MNNDTQSSDQLIIRVGKACNFRCNFCNVSENETHVKERETIDDIVRNFHYKLKYSNLSSGKITVTISGGEPSLFKKETLFALKYITHVLGKMHVEPIFDIQTNAANIDPHFARLLFENGVQSALISFHTIDPLIFEKTIGVPYLPNFEKIEQGITNLHNARMHIFTNTILSKENQDNFFDTVQYIGEKFPYIEEYHLGLIQPHGEAEKILENIMPKYDEVADIYNRAISHLRARTSGEVVSHYTGLPPCYLEDIGVSLEITENLRFRKSANISDHFLINSINDTNKVQLPSCRQCLYNSVCSGIWKEYESRQKVLPIPYYSASSGNPIPSYAHILTDITEDMQALFNNGVRQILFTTELGTIDALISLFEKARMMGFYKITLILKHPIIITDRLLRSGVNNIQGASALLDQKSRTRIESFSHKYFPQFRIDLDLV